MVREKSWTEVEQIAILKAVLANKDVLEEPKKPGKRPQRHDDVWRQKWDEVATEVDAYFGTSRGTAKTRDLYRQWKYAATKKFRNMKSKTLSGDDFEANLTMPERILQQICPNLFPKVNYEAGTTSTEVAEKGVNGGSQEVVDGSSEDTENGQEETSNDDEQAEAAEEPEAPTDDAEETTDAQPQVPAEGQDSELSELVLSLQSMIDIQHAVNTTVVEDVLAALENSDQKMEGLDDIGEVFDAQNEDAGPSLAAEEVVKTCDEPSAESDETAEKSRQEEAKEFEGMKKDKNLGSAVETAEDSGAKETTGEKMEVVPTFEASNEKAAGNSIEKPEETSEASASEPAVKRKKAPRARNAKKRKLTKDASVRV